MYTMESTAGFHELDHLLFPVLVGQHDDTNNKSDEARWDAMIDHEQACCWPPCHLLINPVQEPNLTINDCPKLSTDQILRIAGQRCIHHSSTSYNIQSDAFIHPYAHLTYISSPLSDHHLSLADARDVDLIHLLLSAAHNLSTQQFLLATELTSRCLWMASASGTPLQRLSFYFAQALEDKINRMHTKMVTKPRGRRTNKGLALGTNNAFLASHQEIPFTQAMQLAGIQAIIEAVKASKKTKMKMKIHIIDLQIRSGVQWTALLQGFAEYSSMIQGVKITAVGTTDQLYMEETGKQLQSFAQSLSLDSCFSFEVVYLTDMKGFKANLLNVEPDDTVAVYSSVMLRSMLSCPDTLENLMREIKVLRPTVMVVIEVEANHNSPSFVDRFIEALLFYSAFFDCLEDCIEGHSESRAIIEGSYFREGILDIVAGEDEERVSRSVRVEVWRAFFRQFGMAEMELSESSKCQAGLVVKQFGRGKSCSVESDGKGLTAGWKGTPLHSLTAWTF